MNCLLCDTETLSLRRNIPCCRACRSDFDEYRKKYRGQVIDILTGKMSIEDFEAQYANPEEINREESDTSETAV